MAIIPALRILPTIAKVAAPLGIQFLAPAARLFLPQITAGVTRGISQAALRRAIIKGGGNISARALGTAYRLIQRQEAQLARSARLKPGLKINVGRLGIASTDMINDFSYRVQLRMRDIKTGDIFDRWISTSTNLSDLSPDEIVRMAGERATVEERYGKLEVLGGDFLGGIRHPRTIPAYA